MAQKVLNGPVGIKNVRSYSGPASLTYGIAVKQGATDGALLAVTGSGQKCLGIIESSDLVGEGRYGIVTWGETIGISGAALAADAEVIVDANGNLIASTAQADNVLGRTKTSTTATGQEVVVFVSPYIR